MLEVDGGDLIDWESCGNPRGKPAIVLHGGPGSHESRSSERFYARKITSVS
jgi:proline iminopeptidase